jgi:hypothetical protein
MIFCSILQSLQQITLVSQQIYTIKIIEIKLTFIKSFLIHYLMSNSRSCQLMTSRSKRTPLTHVSFGDTAADPLLPPPGCDVTYSFFKKYTFLLCNRNFSFKNCLIKLSSDKQFSQAILR